MEVDESNKTRKKIKSTFEIPGVNKFYLNQVKGLVNKNNDILRYRGNQTSGFNFV